jgi:hypothetical protein
MSTIDDYFIFLTSYDIFTQDSSEIFIYRCTDIIELAYIKEELVLT